MTNDVFSVEPNPVYRKIDCEFEDCRFSESGHFSTLAYYPPSYNKQGVNTNPDRNVISYNIQCQTCTRKWHVSTQCGETSVKEY